LVDGYIKIDDQDNPYYKQDDNSDDESNEITNLEEIFKEVKLSHNYKIKGLDSYIKTIQNVHNFEIIGNKTELVGPTTTIDKTNLPIVQLLKTEKIKEMISSYTLYHIQVVFKENDSDPNAKETVIEIKKRFSDFVNLHEEYCNDVELVGHVIPKRPAKNSKNYVKNMVTDSIKSN